MSEFWRLVTEAPVEPIVRLAEPTSQEPVIVAVLVVTAVPVRAALTFAIVAALAPNEERSERIDWTCASVNVAACAIGASASIEVAIASPVATAATFATAFVVTVCITIVNDFRSTIIIKFGFAHC